MTCVSDSSSEETCEAQAVISMGSKANAKRIANIENCFGSSGQPLAAQGRVLVGEGILTKMCRKKLKQRQFFLFNDMLVYGTIIINKKKYNKQHIIPLEQVMLQNIDDDDSADLKNGWLIKTPTKSFAVYAATATEKTEWMAHINKCIEELLKRTGKRPSQEHAAVWVPDAETPVCMNCKKTQFTIINRRHHCRKCGAVVCGPCSTKKFLLPSQSQKPLRVCDACFESLSLGTVPQTPSGDQNEVKNRTASSGSSSSGGFHNSGEVTSPTVAPLQTNESKTTAHADTSDDSDSDDEQKGSGENQFDKLSLVDEKPTFYGDEMTENGGVPETIPEVAPPAATETATPAPEATPAEQTPAATTPAQAPESTTQPSAQSEEATAQQ